MLYLSLASFLSSRAGTQGKKQPRTQQRRPDLLRASAFLSSVLVTTAAGEGVTSPVDQAGLAAEAAHAHPAVAAAVAQSLLPAPGHPEF